MASNLSISISRTTFAYIWIKRRYESSANLSSLKLDAKASTFLSLIPIFKIESIIPGIDTFPPDLTESKRGVVSSLNFFFVIFSKSANAFSNSLSNLSGKDLFSIK